MLRAMKAFSRGTRRLRARWRELTLALRAASFTQAGSFRAAAGSALLIASRAVDASLHSALSLSVREPEPRSRTALAQARILHREFNLALVCYDALCRRS